MKGLVDVFRIDSPLSHFSPVFSICSSVSGRVLSPIVELSPSSPILRCLVNPSSFLCPSRILGRPVRRLTSLLGFLQPSPKPNFSIAFFSWSLGGTRCPRFLASPLGSSLFRIHCPSMSFGSREPGKESAAASSIQRQRYRSQI